jgi:DNA-binding CsgD family transcriptional regulator
MTSATPADLIAQLTPAEQEVLACVVRGYPNRQIASVLCLGLSTVKAHLRSVFIKLGVGNRTEAAMLAVQAGLHLELDENLPVADETRGRPALGAAGEFRDYCLKLAVADAEWAKAQDEGLSALVRRLLAWQRFLAEQPDGAGELEQALYVATWGLKDGLDSDEQALLCRVVLRQVGEVCGG